MTAHPDLFAGVILADAGRGELDIIASNRAKRNGQADAKAHIPPASLAHVKAIATLIAGNGGPFTLTETHAKSWAGRQVRVVRSEIGDTVRSVCDTSPGFWGAMATWVARGLDCREIGRAETVDPTSHRRRVAIWQRVSS